MKRKYLVLLSCLLGVAAPSFGQSLDDLNIQLHGYATQGFLYTTNNNILTTTSSDGSPAWTEAVVNLSAQPESKLRISVQARYFLLGNFGNAITLDYAAADYKAGEQFGMRFGKVKTPIGLFNEIQDIDPSYLFALLPQAVYPITSRNSFLSNYGGVLYGSVRLGPKLGKLDYRGWGGELHLGGDDGYFVSQTEGGISLPNGLSNPTYGAALRWRTPLPGLLLGTSYYRDEKTNPKITAGPLTGSEPFGQFGIPNFFGQYERGKLMVAAEHSRLAPHGAVLLNGLPSTPIFVDDQSWYAMATYKLTEKLSAGVYDSQLVDRAAAYGPTRYSKDWTIAGRYDFSQYLYAKAEEHLIEGTALSYDADLNPNGLKPNTKLTVLKVGVSF